MRSYNIAVVGATGAVGQTMLRVLEERRLPVNELRLLASARSAGKVVEALGDEFVIQEATADSFEGIDIAFFCANSTVSKALAPHAVEAGAVVIDNSSAYRLDPEVPLVVPEVNPQAVDRHRGIIANPNCSTIIMVVALKPIWQKSRIKRIVFATYQAASGAGSDAVNELEEQVRAYVDGHKVEPRVLPVSDAPKHYQLAFNVLPQVDVFADDYYTKEELKMVHETRKILGDEGIGITGTCVRVPVFWCHAEALNIETEDKISREEALELLQQDPHVVVVDNPQEQVYPMPLDYYDRDEVFVGRVREDRTVANGLNLWAVGNQLRKGAATNAVQIAELLIERGL